MSSYRPSINREIIAWGRKSLRLPEERAAQLVGVPVETLREWERGLLSPTMAQLRALSDKYRRPLGVFFLPEPPQDPEPPHDFRTVGGVEELAFSPELLAEFRRARTMWSP